MDDVACLILLRNDFTSEQCNFAEMCLRKFVKRFPKCYGKSSVVYNVHSLLHLCDDARLFGCLNSVSAFPFENMLGKMKKMLRSGNKPLGQLCRRMSELNNHKNFHEKLQNSHADLKNHHFDGPTTGSEAPSMTQFKVMSYLGFEFKLDSEANSYALLSDGKIMKILNIIEEQMEVKLIGQTFSSQKDFNTYRKPGLTEYVGVN